MGSQVLLLVFVRGQKDVVLKMFHLSCSKKLNVLNIAVVTCEILQAR